MRHIAIYGGGDTLCFVVWRQVLSCGRCGCVNGAKFLGRLHKPFIERHLIMPLSGEKAVGWANVNRGAV